MLEVDSDSRCGREFMGEVVTMGMEALDLTLYESQRNLFFPETKARVGLSMRWLRMYLPLSQKMGDDELLYFLSCSSHFYQTQQPGVVIVFVHSTWAKIKSDKNLLIQIWSLSCCLRVLIESCKRIKNIDMDFPLPELAIEHIQSFLNVKEAAKSSVISKSWCRAWSSRPCLNFCQQDFGINYWAPVNNSQMDRFWNYVKQTVQRYVESNLMIENFNLQLLKTDLDAMSNVVELMKKVVKMGVVGMNLAFCYPMKFVMPHEVLEAENLVHLSLTWMVINLPPSSKVTSSRVKSLRLEAAILEDGVLSHIFPFVEDLTLSNCKLSQALNCPIVKSLRVMNMYAYDGFYSWIFPCLEHLSVEFCSAFEPFNYSTVKSLSLKKVLIRGDLISDAFKCLEDLTVDGCYGFVELQVSSHSVKYISVSGIKNLRAKFNVPSIRRFTISVSCYPSKLPVLSFIQVSEEWESNISLAVKGGGHLKDPWCYHLRRFMKKFSGSNVDLSIHFRFYKHVYFYDEKFKGKQGPMVENFTFLTLSESSAYSDILKGFLWSFRPKCITQSWFPSSSRVNEEKTSRKFIKVLYEELIQGGVGSSSQNHAVPIYSGIKHVKVECFDVHRGGWWPLHQMTLLSYLESLETKQKIRFYLEWSEK